MPSLLITTKCRANGRHVAAGEILDETNSDASTLRALYDGGRGRWIEAKPEPKPEPAREPELAAKPETPRRGRPKKEHAES